MKIAIIGDIHGRNSWKAILDVVMDCDKIIFLGDYHDPYLYEFDDDSAFTKVNSISNLLEIIRMKELYPDKIVLLIGNHDAHYMYNLDRCTRFDYDNIKQVEALFKKYRDLFQFAYQYKNHIFTHAGITRGWMSYWMTGKKSFNKKLSGLVEDPKGTRVVDLGTSLIQYGLKDDLSNLADVINLFGNDGDKGTRAVNDISRERGGYAPHGGITWADYYELYSEDIFPKLHQYVGHNKVPRICTNYGIEWTEDNKQIEDKDTSITFLDVLHTDLPLKEKYIILDV